MSLSNFRSKYFNPEKWIVTGITWALLTVLLLLIYDLVTIGTIGRNFWVAAAIFLILGAPFFGLLFRYAMRRGNDNAR